MPTRSRLPTDLARWWSPACPQKSSGRSWSSSPSCPWVMPEPPAAPARFWAAPSAQLGSRARSWQRWGNTSCQPQKSGFFSMCDVVRRGWSQKCLGYLLLLVAKVEGKPQISDKNILLPPPRWVFELNRCYKTQQITWLGWKHLCSRKVTSSA